MVCIYQDIGGGGGGGRQEEEEEDNVIVERSSSAAAKNCPQEFRSREKRRRGKWE